MITWTRMWPFLIAPFVIILALGFIPQATFTNVTYGGPMVRQWFANTVLLPVLSTSNADRLIALYSNNGTGTELAIHTLIALNINALLLPVLYLFGTSVIWLRSAFTRLDLKQKRRNFNIK